jgi:hypothetical protein
MQREAGVDLRTGVSVTNHIFVAPNPVGSDFPEDMRVKPAEFPARGLPTETPDVVLTGHDPSERRAEFQPRQR